MRKIIREQKQTAPELKAERKRISDSLNTNKRELEVVKKEIVEIKKLAKKEQGILEMKKMAIEKNDNIIKEKEYKIKFLTKELGEKDRELNEMNEQEEKEKNRIRQKNEALREELDRQLDEKREEIDRLDENLKEYKDGLKSVMKETSTAIDKLDNTKEALAAREKYDKLFRANLKIYELKWYPKGITCLSPGHRSVKPVNVPPLMVRKAQWRR